jgi:hypothetical protein
VRPFGGPACPLTLPGPITRTTAVIFEVLRRTLIHGPAALAAHWNTTGKPACHSPVQFAVFATLWSTLIGQFRRQAERASHQAGHAGPAAKGLAGRFLGSPAKR